MVREILGYHPKLEMRDSEGRTALFAAEYRTHEADEDRNEDDDAEREESVRLLAQAGDDVNATR